jgi:hypothetical protein
MRRGRGGGGSASCGTFPVLNLTDSVVDPDPDVFGLLDPDPSINKKKKYFVILFLPFLSVKTDVNVRYRTF